MNAKFHWHYISVLSIVECYECGNTNSRNVGSLAILYNFDFDQSGWMPDLVG